MVIYIRGEAGRNGGEDVKALFFAQNIGSFIIECNLFMNRLIDLK